MFTQKSPKSPKFFYCEKCHYNTCKKSDYSKHLLTSKHQNIDKLFTNVAENSPNVAELNYLCECGKKYSHRQSLYIHKKKCNNDNNTNNDNNDNNTNKDNKLVDYLMKENTELKQMIIDVCKNINSTQNNNSFNNTNSHNKTFNLQFFLNETCKDAMNIMEFVDSIKLQLSDLMEIGEIGYVEGISKIIVKNLNNLDETIRPVHCTDKKRETMYIKDDGEWNKEDEKKTKLKKALTKVADKNIKLLPLFREKYPEYKNSYSKTSDKYDKMVLEVMTCDDDKNEKIITTISKVTIIKE